MNLKSRKAKLWSVAIESAAWLSIVALGSLAGILGDISVRGASLLCILIMLGLIWSAWRNFDGGRHPCFLFLGMLFIFQCGSLQGFWTGIPRDPFMNSGQTHPFSVSTASQEITLLLIVISAVSIYIVSRLSYRPVTFVAGPELRWLRPLYILLFITIPFSAYKNYIYLNFVRSHGGYMAIYTDSHALLHSAGLIVRSISLIGITTLLLLYTFERRKRYIDAILVLFLAVSFMDLLIGLRGKFFLDILLLWYIRNLKTGKRFNILPVVGAALMISIIAVAIAGFRNEAEIKLISPLGFLATQGVSINVTALAVQYRPIFAPNEPKFLAYQLIEPFAPQTATSPKHNFVTSLSYFVNASAAEAGYGLGGSYLAEAYLLEGIYGVIAVSILVGLALSWIHDISGTWLGAVVLLSCLGGLIYLPRSELFDPISVAIKSVVALALIAFMILLIRSVLSLLRTKGPTRTSLSAPGSADLLALDAPGKSIVEQE